MLQVTNGMTLGDNRLSSHPIPLRFTGEGVSLPNIGDQEAIFAIYRALLEFCASGEHLLLSFRGNHSCDEQSTEMMDYVTYVSVGGVGAEWESLFFVGGVPFVGGQLLTFE